MEGCGMPSRSICLNPEAGSLIQRGSIKWRRPSQCTVMKSNFGDRGILGEAAEGA